MKLHELRIGNFVHYVDANSKQEVFKILKGSDLDLISSAQPFEYLPISLTEEWLLKLGFDHSWEISTGAVTYTFYDFEGYAYNINDHLLYFTDVWQEKRLVNTGEKILYVHQLQNRWYSFFNRELAIREEL